MKNKLKTNKGITLIALIITIIVLLILAMVSIGLVVNEGIINHAENATSEYVVAEEKEKISLGYSAYQMSKANKENAELIVEEATVVGDEATGWTIKFDKTKNVYSLTEEGIITKVEGTEEKPGGGEISDIEKYILGEQLEGRPLDQIMDFDNMTFKEIPEGANVSLVTIAMDSEAYMIIYCRYNGQLYRFSTNDNTGVTEKSYGVVKVKEIDSASRVGKYVSYDDKLWIILYDDSTNGLQMISKESFLYNRNYFSLGDIDSSVQYWISVDSTTKEFKIADLDENGKLDKPIEQSIYSYNNAITTLNKACDDIVADSQDIINVRCVGSNPTHPADPQFEVEETYSSDNLKKWPTSAPGKGNAKGRDADTNYESDLDRMISLGINGGTVQYWLASRSICKHSDRVRFCLREVDADGICAGGEQSLWHVYESDNPGIMGSNASNCLRPVVSLKSDIKFSVGEGTEEKPFILNIVNE